MFDLLGEKVAALPRVAGQQEGEMNTGNSLAQSYAVFFSQSSLPLFLSSLT